MVAMDAYSDMVIRLSNARLADLCREAAQDRLAAKFGRRVESPVEDAPAERAA